MIPPRPRLLTTCHSSSIAAARATPMSIGGITMKLPILVRNRLLAASLATLLVGRTGVDTQSDGAARANLRGAAGPRRAKLKQPVPIREIDLRELLAAGNEPELQSVLRTPREWLYVVSFEGRPVSSLVVQKVGAEFEPARIGNAGIIKALAIAERARLPSYSLVRFSELNI